MPPDRRAALERFREEVIADVAHELRTPLTAIRAHSEVLLDMAEDEPGGPRRFLEVVDAEAARMVGLIDDLRDVARGETGSTVAHRPWPSA